MLAKLQRLLAAPLLAAPLLVSCAAELPSWKPGATRDAITDFVKKVTTQGSEHFVPREQRIAVFDNDGALWCEQPVYFQALFAFDRIQAMAAQHPEWKNKEPLRSILAGDKEGLEKAGKDGLLDVIMQTHAGMPVREFKRIVAEWLRTAKHPKTGRPFGEMTYAPMVELLQYLRANGFKTFIVSGGGIDFIRAFSELAYGIPPEQVVGSRIHSKFELRDGNPALVKLPKIDLIDDGPGKLVGIDRHIGRRPILAWGNSDGDYEMLYYTTVNNPLPSLGLLLHHTDAEREYAYDRESHVGRLDKALTESQKRGWIVVDMKRDWSRVFGD